MHEKIHNCSDLTVLDSQFIILLKSNVGRQVLVYYVNLTFAKFDC